MGKVSCTLCFYVIRAFFLLVLLGSGIGGIVVDVSIMMRVMVSWLNGLVIRVAITSGACRCTAVNSIHYNARFRWSRFHSRHPDDATPFIWLGCHNPTGIKIGWRAMTHNILHHYCLPSENSHASPAPSLARSFRKRMEICRWWILHSRAETRQQLFIFCSWSLQPIEAGVTAEFSMR